VPVTKKCAKKVTAHKGYVVSRRSAGRVKKVLCVRTKRSSVWIFSTTFTIWHVLFKDAATKTKSNDGTYHTHSYQANYGYLFLRAVGVCRWRWAGGGRMPKKAEESNLLSLLCGSRSQEDPLWETEHGGNRRYCNGTK
jgi:hypothetical protein